MVITVTRVAQSDDENARPSTPQQPLPPVYVSIRELSEQKHRFNVSPEFPRFPANKRADFMVLLEKQVRICPDMTVNDSPEETLTPKQDTFISLLLAGVNISAAAKEVGIAEKTAHRWLALPHFKQAYKSAQKSIFDNALLELKDGVSVAIATLKRHASAEDILPTAATQIRAAQVMIEQALSVDKMGELEAKYQELERLVKASGLVK